MSDTFEEELYVRGPDGRQYYRSARFQHWHLKSVDLDAHGEQQVECFATKAEAQRHGFVFPPKGWDDPAPVLDGVYSGYDGLADAVSAVVSSTVDGLQRYGKTYRVVVTEVQP